MKSSNYQIQNLLCPRNHLPLHGPLNSSQNLAIPLTGRKIQLILNNLHENIVQHYAIDGPDQNLITAEKLRDKQIKLVFSNDKNISSFFSKNVKH